MGVEAEGGGGCGAVDAVWQLAAYLGCPPLIIHNARSCRSFDQTDSLDSLACRAR